MDGYSFSLVPTLLGLHLFDGCKAALDIRSFLTGLRLITIIKLLGTGVWSQQTFEKEQPPSIYIHKLFGIKHGNAMCV
jgi:hypothetical protein